MTRTSALPWQPLVAQAPAADLPSSPISVALWTVPTSACGFGAALPLWHAAHAFEEPFAGQLPFTTEAVPSSWLWQVRHPVLPAGIDEFVTRLLALGREATSVVYQGDGHFFRRENEMDFLARVEALFARCLGGRSEPMEGDRQAGSTARVRTAPK